MAEAVIKSPDTLTCPVCLDLLKGPVTIPCGHSFCLDCIKDCWDQEEQKGVYSCPQCRQSFSPRPPLNKNTMLADLAEGLRKTRVRSSLPAGCGDVECDICTGSKLRAVKSCLVCLLSFCEAHIQPHYDSPGYKKHKLVDAATNLQEKICSVHDKLLEVFCCTDQQCICLLCVMDEHKGHNTVSAAAEKAKKQKQLVETQRKVQQRVQQMENKVQEVKHGMNNLKSSAQAAVDDSEKIFTDMIKSIERRRSEVRELIRDQEKTELSLAEKLMKKLEEEIVDLRRRDAELEQLSHTDDPIQFLQSFASLSAPPRSTDVPHITASPQFSLEDLKIAVNTVLEIMKPELVSLSGELMSPSIPPAVYQKHPKLHQSPEPQSREHFLQYACWLTLDPNTAHRKLCLSEDNRALTVTRQLQSYPDHPERFDKAQQVLCKDSVSGRRYWEVEFSMCYYDVAVCYKSLKRKGKDTVSGFGWTDQSWSLRNFGSSFSFKHNNKQVNLSVNSSSSRIGVYVDHSAGILSFYSVSDTMTLLYTVHTSFTQNLCPGFGAYGYDNVLQICDLN